MGWHRELLVGFDPETRRTDPRETRIVAAAVVEVEGGEPIRHQEWPDGTGVGIPQDAVAIRGATTERAAAEGRPAREMVEETAAAPTGLRAAGVLAVAFNLPFCPRTSAVSPVSPVPPAAVGFRVAAHAGAGAVR